ncbi:hypothetical protein OG422_01150 [Streptomyces sp. NBC_01525]|uniref:Uncharacterized protein n=1 Tax=Streptomyces benahoarensis TaxID=2595054 RepID=A0A553ZLS6_9ACTN|nr:hypothetical protein [Streptomyces benahoarensis]TSB26760.1 hypothetical protein FNJ62_10500 [Streptomyces benahoarensis]TSB42429.1 hypothetical protein FNZ23_09915 [Streptomyces benahoarensis]
MTWASWTTVGIHARPGTVRTVEAGVLDGDVTIHTTWSEEQAHVAVQYTGATDWFTMIGSPVPCFSEEDSRSFHQAVVEAIRGGEDAERELQRLFEQ